MKLLRSSILLSAVVFAVTACNKPPLTNDLPETEAIQQGQDLYMEYCQKCHPDGETGLGPSVSYVPDFSKRFQVRHGIGAMPAFDKTEVSDEELDKIILYLKALGEE